MVNVTQAMESSYIDVDLIRNSPTKKAVILNEGDYVSGEYNGKKYIKFEILVEIDKKQKTWAPNKDSVKNIAAEYGEDSKNWIGKFIKLQLMKVNGKDQINAQVIPMMDNTK